jgi:hypothetical protein
MNLRDGPGLSKHVSGTCFKETFSRKRVNITAIYGLVAWEGGGGTTDMHTMINAEAAICDHWMRC